MIKYFVRTTGERQLDSSYSQIEYELLVDTEHQPLKSFIQQLEIISEYDAILLEDDLILCKDFKSKIETIIEQYKTRIINFFTFPWEYFETRETDRFCYNQCTYYPKGIGKIIAEEMKKYPTFTLGYDVLETRALKHLNIKHIAYRPCLIQHLDNDSFISKIQPVGHTRSSLYFIDYLDELNINYKDAWTEENKNKLFLLMQEKFENNLK